MKIDIFVNQTHNWKPWEQDLGRLNGSEEMVVLLARALRRRNHVVTVYSMWRGINEGVDYFPHVAYGQRAHGDVLIAFKEPKALESSNHKHRFLWTADPTVLTPAQRKTCDRMFAISKWHKKELGWLNPGFDRISYIEPGFDPIVPNDSLLNVSCGTSNKLCLYASSPDRGLNNLLKIWPDILRSHPEALLYVTYTQIDVELDINQDRVKLTGRLSNQDMADLYRKADLLLYPCTGGERFCLTAIRAQYYGCIPCVIPTMALQDTVQYGVKSLKERYLQDTIDLLGDEERKQKIRADMEYLRFYSWGKTALYWEKVIDQNTSCSN